MKTTPAVLLFTLFIFGFGLKPAWGQLEGSASLSTAGTTPEAVTRFLGQLQTAVAKDRREDVAKLFFYPAKCWGGKNLTINNRKMLLSYYEAIFTPPVKKAIAEARLENVWANWQGVMLHNGLIWFSTGEDKGPLKIVTINAP